MSVLFFAAPHCNYCSLQKDCKIKLGDGTMKVQKK